MGIQRPRCRQCPGRPDKPRLQGMEEKKRVCLTFCGKGKSRSTAAAAAVAAVPDGRRGARRFQADRSIR